MDTQILIYVIVGATFLLYIAIAIWARAGSTSEFYAANRGVNPVVNGMATAADWMSAASFISMAGLIAFGGYGSSAYLMGWTGGYVLLAMLLAPYLRKFGKYTVPEFIGDRFYSQSARLVAVLALIVCSVTYVIGQMKGVGVTFSRFLEVPADVGLFIGAGIVFIYAVLGGMKGITYTQVAQYIVLITAYTIPAFFISAQLTDASFPQMALFSEYGGTGAALLERLNAVLADIGFSSYTEARGSTLNMVLLTLTLMIGTAGLPHVIIRFFTVPRVADARWSAGWALVFICLLYTTAPAVGAMVRLNLIDTLYPGGAGEPGGAMPYDERPNWMRTWQETGLLQFAPPFPGGEDEASAAARQSVADVLEGNEAATAVFAGTDAEGNVDEVSVSAATADGDIMAALMAAAEGRTLSFLDRNGDGLVQYYNAGNADFAATAEELGWAGNEFVKVDRDIMVLANPEIAGLPGWVIALVAAGGLAAALSTAAGLLLAISGAISHDLIKGVLNPKITEQGELWAARISMTLAIAVATYLGLNPPGFAAQVVALAFGLAASSIFPPLMMGIFFKRINSAGAIMGMLAGLSFTLVYIFLYKGWLFLPGTNQFPDTAEYWLFGISPGAIGCVGALINFVVAYVVAKATAEPPQEIQQLVESIRVPRGAGPAAHPSAAQYR